MRGQQLAVGWLRARRDGDLVRSGRRDPAERSRGRRCFRTSSAIVVSGHSAGGQFVTRYQMANRVHDTLGIRVRYVVANPSSYAYPDPVRPVIVPGTRERKVGVRAVRRTVLRQLRPMAVRAGRPQRVHGEERAPRNCESSWSGGPRRICWASSMCCPWRSFDASCAAMAQGPTRLARGRAFAAYVNRAAAGEAHRDNRAGLRSRRTVHVHRRAGAAVLFPKP